ncbi:hypothetical protein D3C76_513950 [compost metagenome]
MLHPFSQKPLRHARDYAQAIVDCYGNVALQRELFEACPLELRGIARELANSALERLKHRATQQTQHRALVQQAAQTDPTPFAPSPRLSELKKSAPEVGQRHLAELRKTVGARA